MNGLVYDLEIVRAIPTRGEEPMKWIEYCEGWTDHKNMGISVLGVYDYVHDRYHTFCEDNFDEFRALVERRDIFIGFNSVRFDNAVIKAVLDLEIPETKCYDIMRELMAAADTTSFAGFNLNATAHANLREKKTGHGALGPVQWQQGEIGSVIDYCLADVWLTKRLFDQIVKGVVMIDPRDTTKMLTLRRP